MGWILEPQHDSVTLHFYEKCAGQVKVTDRVSGMFFNGNDNYEERQVNFLRKRAHNVFLLVLDSLPSSHPNFKGFTAQPPTSPMAGN